MPRRHLDPRSADWTIDLGDDFAAQLGTDGYTTFTAPDRSARSIVYEPGGESPQTTLADWLDVRQAVGDLEGAVADYPLDAPAGGLVGRAYLVPEEQGAWSLRTWAAAHGVVAEVAFRFARREQAEWALAAWRTIGYAPPEWERLRAAGGAFLEDLRRALLQGWAVDDVVEKLHESGRAADAVPMLTAALKDGREVVRRAACFALECSGDAAGPALPALRQVLRDPECRVRIAAAQALGVLGEPAGPLVAVLSEELLRPDATPLPRGRDRVQGQSQMLVAPPRLDAAIALGQLGEAAAAAAPALRRALADPSGIVRVEAARALLQLGEPPQTVVQPLLNTLNDVGQHAARERCRAADVLFEMVRPPEALVPALAELVREDDWTAQAEAFVLLGKIGPSASEAVPALRAALDHRNAWVRLEAAFALWNVSRRADGAFPVLRAALDQEADAITRARILFAFGEMGDAAREALPSAHEALEDEDLEVRASAASAVWRIEKRPDVALPVLAEAVRSDLHRFWRTRVAACLAEMGTAARPAAAALRHTSGEDDAVLASAALDALAKVDPGPAASLAELTAELRLPDEPARCGAALALGRAGAVAVAPLLEALTKDPAPRVRWCAALALGELGPAAKAAVPILIRAVESSSGRARDVLHEVIRKIDPTAAPAASR